MEETKFNKINASKMNQISSNESAMICGGTGDEHDWVDAASAMVRNLARGTRGFFNGFFGYDDCHCY